MTLCRGVRLPTRVRLPTGAAGASCPARRIGWSACSLERTGQIRAATAGCGDLRRSPQCWWDPELGRRGGPAAFERTVHVQFHTEAQAL